MSFSYVVLHYPEPDRRQELLDSMREMAERLSGVPGLVEAGPWYDEATDCLVGLSRWDSKEAFLAAGITPLPPGEVPDGERRPRERLYLERQ